MRQPRIPLPGVRRSLPNGMSPTGVFTTNSSSIVIKAAADRDHRSLYSWDAGKGPKLIVEGGDLDITRLSDDTFAAWYSDNNQEEIVTLDAQKLISQPTTDSPEGWPHRLARLQRGHRSHCLHWRSARNDL
jgi:hypothetical protein